VATLEGELSRRIIPRRYDNGLLRPEGDVSSSLAAAIDPEIEIKYLPIATSRSFIPYNTTQHSNADLRVREVWFIEKEDDNGKVFSMIETTENEKTASTKYLYIK